VRQVSESLSQEDIRSAFAVLCNVLDRASSLYREQCTALLNAATPSKFLEIVDLRRLPLTLVPVCPSFAALTALLQQPDEALTFVATTFKLTDYETNAKNAILVDFYLWILIFCKEHGFNEEKTSAALTIVRLTHEFALTGGKTVQETFAEFKRLVLKHSLAGAAADRLLPI